VSCVCLVDLTRDRMDSDQSRSIKNRSAQMSGPTVFARHVMSRPKAALTIVIRGANRLVEKRSVRSESHGHKPLVSRL